MDPTERGSVHTDNLHELRAIGKLVQKVKTSIVTTRRTSLLAYGDIPTSIGPRLARDLSSLSGELDVEQRSRPIILYVLG
jgi:hypothetical protein